jgi:signal transduction histidine kinase
MLVSTVMVATLLISVVVGGTLLLREARREASDAARKTSFVSNVSHELKTPLTTIRMYAELLGDGRMRAPEKQHTYLATIIGESQRLTRLVNNVLDFSRMDQGRKKYHPDNVPIGSVVENVLMAQRPRLQEAGLECGADLPPEDDVRVHVDRDALEQVLLNLLDNAMKYAADGHWVGVRITKDANNAILTVKDHGPGVPPAHREKIFDVFHRVDDSITARQPGSGLGLSIARRLLRDQGGDLRFEPNLPVGSTFIATIPLAAPIVQFDVVAREA